MSHSGLLSHMAHKHKEIEVTRKNYIQCKYCNERTRKDTKHEQLCAQFGSKVEKLGDQWLCRVSDCGKTSHCVDGILRHCLLKHRKNLTAQGMEAFIHFEFKPLRHLRSEQGHKVISIVSEPNFSCKSQAGVQILTVPACQYRSEITKNS